MIEKTLEQFKLENGIQKQEKLENNKDEIFILLHYAAMITLFFIIYQLLRSQLFKGSDRSRIFQRIPKEFTSHLVSPVRIIAGILEKLAKCLFRNDFTPFRVVDDVYIT